MVYAALIATTAGIFESTSEELDGQDVMFISLPNTPTNRTLVATDQNATLSWGANTLFAGRCTGAEYTRGMLKCTCYNQIYEALARAQPLDITYDPAVNHASDVLTAIAATIGIASVWHGTDPAIGARLSFTNPMDALEWLAKTTNNDFWTTTGPLTIHVGVRGAARGEVAILEDSKRVIDRAKQRNNIRVRGVDETGGVIYGIATAGGATRYATFTEKKASTVANLNDLAAKLLAEANKIDGPSPLAVSLTVGNGLPLFPGDTVTITQADLGLPAGSYRIYKVVRSIDKVTISVAYPADTIDKKLWDTRKYEELGIYTVAAGQIPKGIQSWNSNIVFTAADWDTATWTAGTITFADGSTLLTNAGSTGNLGVAGTYYVYFTYGSAALVVTGTYSDAVGPSKGLLAKLIVSTDTTQKIGIETSGSKGTTIIKDHIAEDAVFAESMRPGIQPYHTNLEFLPKVAETHDKVQWAAGVVEFADGSTQAIDAGSTADIPDGAYRYIYFTLGSTTLTMTSNYLDVVGNAVGLLAKVYASARANQEVFIMPYKSKGENFIVDFLGAKSVDTVVLSSEEIFGKDIGTQQYVGVVGGSAGIRIIGDLADIVGTPIGDAIGGNFTAGIWGFAAGPSRTFFLDPTTGEINVYGTGMFRLIKADGTPVGTLDMTEEGGRDVIKILTVGGTKDIILESGGYNMRLRGDGDIDVLGSATLDLGDANTHLILPLKADDPVIPRDGEIWVKTI